MKGMKGTKRGSVGNLMRNECMDERDERDKVSECEKCEEEERYG